MATLILAFILVCLCFAGFGVSVLFFGKKASKSECGSVPEAVHEDCPSHVMGICPLEDTRKEMQYFHKTKLTDRS